jgi:metallo-beta-lactamase class B
MISATLPARKRIKTHLVFTLAAASVPFAAPVHAAEPAGAVTGAELATACKGHDGWADPAPPTRVFGNTWYVGTCGITVLLVTSERGHILIDSGPAEAAPLVAANIERLGFKLSDVRWILSSHEHDDHVGGLAALQQRTGAAVGALASAALALSAGKPAQDDPQRAIAHDFAPVRVDRTLRDGQIVAAGPLRLTVHATPAHAPGSASWTWSSCDGGDCRTITYADSASVISADDYRYTDHTERVAAVRQGLARIKALPCGILLTPHPGASDLFARLSGKKPLADSGACRAYGEQAEQRLAARLASEAAGAAK